ncbi:MAG: efflux RND transporter periplasmic adaptor subunit [Alistipes sp.]|nr:efflux RND transporter periplasmic adaptor subunit [Alistipes sp.]
MKKYRFLLAVVLLVVTSCKLHVSDNIPEPIVVSTARVESESIDNRHTFISTLSPNYEAIVQPRVSGYLSAKLFDNGMPVKKGQVIFRIDGREQRANLLAAKASLESAKAKAIESKNNYARAVPLAAIDAISQAQLDQYTAQYLASEASVKSAEQTLANAILESEYTTITASINGVISASEAYVGDFVGPGTKFATLTRIQNIDTLCVELAIPMRQYLDYSGRRSFTYNNDSLLSDIALYLADGSHYPLSGSYSYTKSSVADSAGTIILVVTFPNPNYLLKAGQFARVATNIGEAIQRLTLPRQAIQQMQGVNYVWVVRPDSTVEYRKVAIGQTISDRQIVNSGVSKNEIVVINSNAKLSNGQKVKL